jgi:hypothetical protein
MRLQKPEWYGILQHETIFEKFGFRWVNETAEADSAVSINLRKLISQFK